MEGRVEPTATVAVVVTASLLAVRPLRWAWRRLGDLGRVERPAQSREVVFWQAFAARFNLSFEIDADGAPRVEGRLDGIPFHVRPDGPSQRGKTPMVMTGIARPALTVVSPLHQADGCLHTGDGAFDPTCRTSGDLEVVAASLDARARVHVSALIAGGGTLDRGQAILPLPGRLDEEAARAAANLVFHAAFAIDHAPGARLSRLLGIADADPVPAVRARALAAARRVAPSDPAVVQRLTRASRAPTDSWAALIGHLHVDDVAGAVTLLVESEEASLIQLAAEVADVGALGALLEGLVGSPDAYVQQVVAEGALRADAPTRLLVLAGLASVARSPAPRDAQVAALRALAWSCRDTLGDTFDTTMARVAGHPWDIVSDVAIGALLAHGTVAAVPVLREEEGRATRAAAERIRSVIASIQARIGPVDLGRLSLIHQDETGRVSLSAVDLAPSATSPEDLA